MKKEYGEYEDYYRDAKKKHTGDADETLINVNIQLNYKGEKLVELRDMTRDNLKRANDLTEKLLENRDALVEVHRTGKDVESGITHADAQVAALNRRETMKKYMLVALIVLLGLLDFIALIFKITRLFR